MNIVLIGMRGSGKTTVAKLLGKALQKDVFDLDEELIKHAGMKIDDIVKKHGWDGFRKKESQIAEKFAKKKDVIISAGGGVVLNEQNMKHLKTDGKVIYLETAIEKILQRINIDAERPALTDKKNPIDEMKQIFQQRKYLYENAADEIVNTNLLKPKAVVEQIIQRLNICI